MPNELVISSLEEAARRAKAAIDPVLGGMRYVLVVGNDGVEEAFVISNCDQVNVSELADMLTNMYAVETEQ